MCTILTENHFILLPNNLKKWEIIFLLIISLPATPQLKAIEIEGALECYNI